MLVTFILHMKPTFVPLIFSNKHVPVSHAILYYILHFIFLHRISYNYGSYTLVAMKNLSHNCTMHVPYICPQIHTHKNKSLVMHYSNKTKFVTKFQ